MTRCAVIPFLYTLKLTVERHFCSIFEHKVLDRPGGERAYRRAAVDYEPERGFINRKVNM